MISRNAHSADLALLLMLCMQHTTHAFQFVPENREVVYEYVGTVSVGAQAPMENDNSKPPPSSGWKIRGTLKLQRRDNVTLAAAVSLTKFQKATEKSCSYTINSKVGI